MNKIQERLAKKIRAVRDEIFPRLLINRMRKGAIIDLPQWDKIPPHISDYGTISCETRFKKLSQTLSLEKKIVLSIREMWNIYNWVLKTKDIKGDIAELGVFRGGSAKLICEAKDSRELHLFDTFDGMPENDYSTNKLKTGDVKGDTLSQVKSYLSSYTRVSYYPGIFPTSAAHLKKELPVFSFVHLDADIYEATADGLKFFYPLMSKGGVILCHDYRTIHLPGVKKAVDEFFKDKPETVVELWDTQAMIVKL